MSNVEISVVCAVTRDTCNLEQVHREYREVLADAGRDAEFIYVMDGPWTGAEEQVKKIRDSRFRVRIYRMAKGFGEATALQFGFERATGRYILTIPNRPQIDARATREILMRLQAGEEFVVTRRDPRVDAAFNRVQSRAFHALMRRLTGQGFRDLTCGLRGMTREAALSLDLYGDLQRFIPILALRQGYFVVEIPAPQHEGNRGLRVRGPGIYARRLLDILNVYFLTSFTRKPLRFFGLIGLTIGSLGGGICGLLAIQRLFFDAALAGRPLLLLGVVLVVLGVQVTSIGLLGEIIIFLSSRRETPQVRELDEAATRQARTPVESS